MKALNIAILALLCLLQGTSAQTVGSSNAEVGLHPSANASLTELSTTTAAAQIDHISPLIDPQSSSPFSSSLISGQLTSTENSQDLSLSIADIDSNYGKMIQDFAATLQGSAPDVGMSERASKRHQILDLIIGFSIELMITLIVLQAAFQLSDYHFRLQQVLPLSLAVATVSALLGFTLDLGLFNPTRIGLGFIVMLILLRLMTEVHELAAMIQMALTARLLALGLTWLVSTGMMVFFGI